MSTQSKAASTTEEIAAIQELMRDLEKRLSRLTGAAKREFSGGSAELDEFVSDALSGIMNRVRDGAHSVSHSVADKATDLSSEAFRKLSDEMKQRPLTMLAIATGVGYLFGMSRR